MSKYSLSYDIFFRNKCGKDKDELKFWKWCANKTTHENEPIKTRCVGLDGSGDIICEVDISYKALRYNYTGACEVGKKTRFNYKSLVSEGFQQSVVAYCNQVLKTYNSLPLWLILLIVLLVLLAVGIAGGLFWRLWLRKRLYPIKHTAQSTIESQLTMGPDVSNATSALDPLSELRGRSSAATSVALAERSLSARRNSASASAALNEKSSSNSAKRRARMLLMRQSPGRPPSISNLAIPETGTTASDAIISTGAPRARSLSRPNQAPRSLNSGRY